MTHIACETELRSVVTSCMHPCPGNCVAIGRAVVNSFSAGIKCRHCTYFLSKRLWFLTAGCIDFNCTGTTGYVGFKAVMLVTHSK